MSEDQDLFVVGPWGTGFAGYRLADDEVRARATDATREGVIAKLHAREDRLTDLSTRTPTPLPAPVLPERHTTFCGFVQSRPADATGPWERLCALGFLHRNPDWDGILITAFEDRTTWIHLSAAEVVSIQSTLTPRLWRWLGGAPDHDALSLAEGLSRPERLASLLSRFERLGDPRALTGALLGAELASTRPYWLGQRVAIIRQGEVPDYTAALRVQGVPVEEVAFEAVLGAGALAFWGATT